MPSVMRKPRRLQTLNHLVTTFFGVGTGLSRFLPSLFRTRSALVAENLFLRKQLAFYRERAVEPRRLTDAARICLVVWSRLFNWREALLIVKPETLIGWHRKGIVNSHPCLGFQSVTGFRLPSRGCWPARPLRAEEDAPLEVLQRGRSAERRIYRAHARPECHLAAKKYQFLTRCGSGPKFWDLNARNAACERGVY